MGECDWLEPVEGKLGGGVKPGLKPRLTAFPIRRRYSEIGLRSIRMLLLAMVSYQNRVTTVRPWITLSMITERPRLVTERLHDYTD
jgi:hypothetical protein